MVVELMVRGIEDEICGVFCYRVAGAVWGNVCGET
jgi:hypothetical protein